VLSEAVKPGSSALVESESNKLCQGPRQGPDASQIGSATVDRLEVELEVNPNAR